MAATWARASRVNPQPAVITQSDGSQITVYAHGDADSHWYTLSDGTLLMHEGYDYYVAKVSPSGQLTNSKVLAHEPAVRDAKEAQLAQAQNRKLFAKQIEAASDARRISIGTGRRYFPHTGSPKALVILVNFADTTFSVADPVKTFNQYLNSTLPNGELENFGNRENRNYGSVLSYFKDMCF